MIKIVQSENWIPNGEIILEDNAKVAVYSDENILVVAGPGAGKTELLAQKACFLLQTNTCKTPRKILAISFKKDAAENLKQRVYKRCGDDTRNRFISMTYDAFSKRILDHFRCALPEILRPNADYLLDDKSIIDSAFKKSGYHNPYNLSPSKLQAHYDATIASVDFTNPANNLSKNVWLLLLKGFDNYSACLTFKMISILGEYIIKTNPKIRKALLSTYSHVFLDEFQDTTDFQYTLIKTCFKNTSIKITAVGDAKQRIMVWAGARETVFDDFLREFSATKIQLIMNHRSAPKLVALQMQMYRSLQEDRITIQTSSKWKKQDGQIKLYITENESQEATHIVQDIKTKVESGVKLDDICILCKKTPSDYTKTIIDELNNIGIKARIETEYQDLLKEPLIILFVSFFRLIFLRKSPSERGLINESIMLINGISSLDSPDEYYKKQKELTDILNTCIDDLKQINTQEELEIVIDKIIDFWGANKLKTTYSAYIQGEYFDKTKNRFIELLWSEYTQSQKSWISAIKNFIGLNSIPIMTIHKSKGLEYRTVYFIGLEDKAFWNFKNRPIEEKCAFFVALSRAKQHVIFTYCNFRKNLQYPHQTRSNINEFFELLNTPEVAEIVTK